MSAIAGYFLLSEHQAHVVRALPYLLLFGCLLMHVFMHGGHGGHGSPDAGKAARIESPPESQPPRVNRVASTVDTSEPK